METEKDNCCCECHKMDIIALTIPDNHPNIYDRFSAYLIGNNILALNNQKKDLIRLNEQLHYYTVIYGDTKQKGIKKKVIKDNIVVYYI